MSFEDKDTAEIFFEVSDCNLIPFDNSLSDSYMEYGQKKPVSQLKWFSQKWNIPLHEMSHPKTISKLLTLCLEKVHSSTEVLKKIIF